jgi:hypothetical protein
MVDPRPSPAWLVAGVSLIVVIGCASGLSGNTRVSDDTRIPDHTQPQRASATQPPNVAPGAPLAPLVTSSRSPVSLRRQGVVIELPEAESWQIAQRGTFTLARHAETASELWVKRWHQGERVSTATCAHQAELWQPAVKMPEPAPERTLTLEQPADHHTAVTLHGWSNGDTWYGQLTAHGAAIRDCLTFVYQTRAPASSLGKAVVNQRLRAVLDSLPTMHVQKPTELPQ